jgi:hypothetical protein
MFAALGFGPALSPELVCCCLLVHAQCTTAKEPCPIRR